MLSLTTEQRLADLIGAIASNERELERRRQILLDDSLFSPSSCFARLDKYCTGYLTPYDIKDFLRDNGIAVTISEVTQLIESIVGRSSLRLYMGDFMHLVLPKDSPFRSMALRRDAYPSSLRMSSEFGLARLIQAAIDGNSRLERPRFSLQSRYDFDSFDAFQSIDRHRTGYIQAVDLLAFTQRVGCGGDAEYFIMALDQDYDGKLSYTEFMKGLTLSLAEPELRSFHSERKPAYRELSYDRAALRTEHRGRRLWSEDRYEATREYTSPFRKSYGDTFKEPFASSYKTTYTTPLKKTHESPRFHSAATEYTTPSRTYRSSLAKKLDYDFSPSRKQAEISMALTMEKQLRYEKEIEQAKEELALQPEFNMMEGFRLFDRDAKGYITMSEFYDGMKRLDVIGSYDDIRLLFNRMDINKVGRVKYSDYYITLAPKQREYEKLVLDKPPYRESYSSGFSIRTRLALKDLLSLLLEYEKYSELMRQRLKRDINFNPYDAFSAVDLKGKGHISQEGLREFLDSSRIYANEAEVSGLLEKYDHNRDGKITLTDFIDELRPTAY